MARRRPARRATGAGPRPAAAAATPVPPAPEPPTPAKPAAAAPPAAASAETPGTVLAATLVVLAEAAVVLGLAAWVLVDAVFGAPTDRRGAIGIALLGLLAAGALGWAGLALRRLRPAAVAPILVLQIVALGVAYFQISGGVPGIGVAILLPALAVVLLLFSPSARAVLRRR